MGNLTVLKMKALTEPGRYSDGDGLTLDVSAKGSASWLLRIMIAGKRRDIDFGSLKVLTLAEARAKAADYRRQIAQGIDPVAERKKVADSVSTLLVDLAPAAKVEISHTEIGAARQGQNLAEFRKERVVNIVKDARHRSPRNLDRK